MPGWPTVLLVVAALVVPAVWGFAVSWVVDRIWPQVELAGEDRLPPDPRLPLDYHI